MKYLIIGRTASGKDTLAKMLRADYGMTLVKSSTTRPKRSDDEDTHIFVTAEEAAAETHKVAQTEIDGHEYYATYKTVNEADIYVIDPEGARELSHNMPHVDFHIVYLSASPEAREKHFIERACAGDGSLTEDEARELFRARDAAEDKRFSAFEGCIATNAKLETWGFGDSVRAVHVLENDYDPESMGAYARMLDNLACLLRRTAALIPVACKLGLMSGAANTVLILDNVRGETYPVSHEWCADTIVGNDESMANFLKGLFMAADENCVSAFIDAALDSPDGGDAA